MPSTASSLSLVTSARPAPLPPGGEGSGQGHQCAGRGLLFATQQLTLEAVPGVGPLEEGHVLSRTPGPGESALWASLLSGPSWLQRR